MKKTIKVTWILTCLFVGTSDAILNEWAFELDAAGRSLSQAENTGSAGSVFESGGSGFLETDGEGGLLCIHSNVDVTGMWTNGAVLNAAVSGTTSGVYYLRYDLSYDLSSPSNRSGMVTGLSFADSTGAQLAGVVFADVDDSPLPDGSELTLVADNLTLTGTVSIIERLDLDAGTLDVWYDLAGSNEFTEATPDIFGSSVNLSTLGKLQFQATGDFRPDGSADFVNIKNLRMADSWNDIVDPIPDFSAAPDIRIVSVTVTNPGGTAGADIGETNTVNVVIRSLNGPVSNLISSVTAATHPEYFTITSSNAPVVLTYPQYVTNTFSLVANTNAPNGTHTFNVNATGSGGVNTNTVFNLTVGSLISYQTNSIEWVSGGILSNKYEPGEVIDVTVFITNNGAIAVSNIVNSLFANPAYFTISNLTSSTYFIMGVGDSTSTVYRVAISSSATNGTYWFGVTNLSGSRVWTDAFPLNIFSQGTPSVSPSSITMSVFPGSKVTNTQVIVTNSGNVAVTFNITDNGTWGVSYAPALENRGISGFEDAYTAITLKDPNTNSSDIEAHNAGVSTTTDIGFSFPFYGTTYSNLYVTADGMIGLSNTTNVPSQSLDRQLLPAAGVDPLIAPFWGALNSPDGSIKTIGTSNYRVISYTGVSKESGGTNLQFQVALYTNGAVEFRYKNITGVTNAYGLTNVTIGLQGSTSNYTNLTAFKPVNGVSILLSPQQNRWITYAPAQNVSIAPQSSQVITFIADASGKAAGSGTTFSAVFNWSTGSSNAVVVSASVTTAAPVYSAVSSLSFTGVIGQVTSVPFFITNTGTSPLDFTISDNASAISGFITTNPPYSWIDTATDAIVLNDPDPSPYITAADEGFSDGIPIGFPFQFCGNTFTQLFVSVNGALRFDTAARLRALGDLTSINNLMPAKMIAPYWGELGLDENASIKYLSTASQLVITWANVRQYGLLGGSNLTFQTILKPNGDVIFQYQMLEGSHWANTAVGLRGATNRFVWADIRQPGDWTVTTNQYGTVSTQYVSTVSNRAVQFLPAQIQTIRYTPGSGTIPAGTNALIAIIGDVSNQSIGLNNIVTNSSLSIFNNAGSAKTLIVTFTVTNSQETVFTRAAAMADDSDGDGLTDDAERIAGSDPQDAGSVFAVSTASGRVLSWPSAEGRTYTVWYTLDLTDKFMELDGASGLTVNSFTDTAHADVAVIYYKVTVD